MDQADERERLRGLRRLWGRLRRWGGERIHLTDQPDERARRDLAHEGRERRDRRAAGEARRAKGAGADRP